MSCFWLQFKLRSIPTNFVVPLPRKPGTSSNNWPILCSSSNRYLRINSPNSSSRSSPNKSFQGYFPTNNSSSSSNNNHNFNRERCPAKSRNRPCKASGFPDPLVAAQWVRWVNRLNSSRFHSVADPLWEWFLPLRVRWSLERVVVPPSVVALVPVIFPDPSMTAWARWRERPRRRKCPSECGSMNVSGTCF